MGQRNVRVVITERAPSVGKEGQLGQGEAWAARTVDGVWEMRREDVPGTPWVVLRAADGRRAGTYGSLPACCRAIGSGVAAFEADRCPCCGGSGRALEWREGPEHAHGFVAYEKRGAVIAYHHDAGPCPTCAGTGRAPALAA